MQTFLKRNWVGLATGLGEEKHFDSKHGKDLRDADSMELLLRAISGAASRKASGKSKKVEKPSWRLQMGHVLEHHIAHLLILLLIFMDVLAVFGEIMLSRVCDCHCTCDHDAHPHVEVADSVETAEHVLHYVSLSILSTMLLHQVLLIVAYGLTFFTKIWYILDFVVVAVAFALELALTSDEESLLVILLSWRVVRVVSEAPGPM
jgi:hypothetical protein